MLRRKEGPAPATAHITINVPFDFCKGCKRLEVSKTDYYANDEICARFYSCIHSDLCENAVELMEKHTDRRERPYDAMGEDQGRGEYTADEAYRKEFVEKYNDQEDE